MSGSFVLSTAIFVALALVVALVARPSWTAGRGGRILAFFGFFLFPVALLGGGVILHLEHAKSTEFCLSCHVMEPYGASLEVDDERLAATHFQNNRVPRESACFTCHTDYTMFGDVNAKLRGLKHVWVYYVTGPPQELALYSPYRNRECLHCHDGARSFEEDEIHVEVLADLRGEVTSCLECHAPVHDVATVADAPRWEPAKEGGDG